MQGHLRENGKPAIKIFEDASFKGFQDSLDSEMKRLTSLGVDLDVKQAQPFSEEKLWSSKVLGSHNARVSLDTLVVFIGNNFSLRSGQEHRRLRFSQLSLVGAKGNEEEKCSF
ncbi:Zinc finger MYM-type 3, partial [Paramuricea clavata]